MKKVLYLADAYKIDRHPLDFAGFVCQLLHAPLTGLFVELAAHDSASEKALREEMICSGGDCNRDTPMEILRDECIQRNLSVFRNTCDEVGFNAQALLISDHIADTVVTECRYADLLLIDPALGLSVSNAGHSPSMARNILSQSECPVILVPERFDGLEEIVFAYDGSPSSVFAIKQFCALFPRLTDRRLTVLTAHGETWVSKKELQLMGDWLRGNFREVKFVNAGDDSRIALLEYVLEKDKLLIVMGAYGRSGWSAFVSASHAEPLAKFVSKALFISHH
ncbi:universal stress protein [Chitinophaga caseinilytica]|uniref:Universal stress protein n=1 Tax=Chitinophaga caseinilytica TaxID=2267521 RepID=A0ABZ2YW17_9BACT